jgi:spore maturation protein CgeB
MKTIKSKLKKISWVFALNACIKARRGKSIYFNTVKYYSKKIKKDINDKKFKKIPNRRLNFFYLGTDELQDRSGILQGLENLGDLTFFTKRDGSYGQYVSAKTLERKQLNSERVREIFRNLKESDKTPDILIAQTFSSYIDANVFSELKKEYGTVMINIGMDDRHQWWPGIHQMIPHLDLALTAAPECVDWYLKEGCPALFFPEASDSNIFKPMNELPKIHEVSFVGAKYGVREEIISALQNAGVQVTTFGGGWGKGFLPVEEVPKLFAQSKIVLGVGAIGHSSDFYALKMRDFDGPMSGSCYITHDNKDLESLYDIGKEIVTYKSINECVEKVRYLLENATERERIAHAGYLRALRDHTWTHRFKGLIDFLQEE